MTSDKHTHLVQYLAAYTVSKESGIMCLVDGMRKLFQSETTTGITPQEMQLVLDFDQRLMTIKHKQTEVGV